VSEVRRIVKVVPQYAFSLLLQTNVCKPVTNHLLPAGWSLEKRDFVMKAKREPLSFMRIGVVRDTRCFLKFWELVLKGAGASVFGITQETCKFCTFHSALIVILEDEIKLSLC
jgi:hypothetical protein